MKKFVRFMFALIGIIILGVLILTFVEPSDVTVTRSIIIKAPKDAVFEQVVNFKNWHNWSPWEQKDSAMKITLAGSDGQAGSSLHWVSDPEKNGEVEIKNENVTGTEMDYSINIIKPGETQADGSIIATDTNNMTKVVWKLHKHFSFPFNASLIALNLDKLLGGDFETGLANIKKYVESHTTATTGTGIDIKEVDYPEHIFEGIRKMVYWTDMLKFFNDGYDIVAGDVGDKIEGHQVGIFYTWDTVNKQADMAAAFPVTDTTMPVKGTVFIHAGPAKAVMAVEKGNYNNSFLYHNAIMKYMAAKGQAQTMVIEEYVVGPKQEADSSKWVTNIYYLVK